MSVGLWSPQGCPRPVQLSNGKSPPPPISVKTAEVSWLIIPEEDLRLGRVYESKTLEHRLHIRNTGNEPVTIARFVKDCDCLGITPDKDVTLEPGETREFRMKLSPRSKVGYADYGQTIPYHVRFGAQYSKGGRGGFSADWELTCGMVVTLRPQPATIHLGTLSDRQPQIERSVTVETSKEVAWINCETPSRWAAEVSRDKRDSSPNKFHLTIRSAGDLRPGTISDVIRLIPLDSEGERLPEREIRINGEIVRDVVASPREIHFGRQPCGTAKRTRCESAL